MITVYIDNCAWDILYNYDIDLLKELPVDLYEVLITGEEVFEINAIPENDPEKLQKKTYIQNQIQQRHVKTDKIFGFYNCRFSPDNQRFAGYGLYGNSESGGRFIKDKELELIRKEKHMLGKEIKTSGLFNHEGDISISARSLYSIVLTNDNKKIKYPIHFSFKIIVTIRLTKNTLHTIKKALIAFAMYMFLIK